MNHWDKLVFVREKQTLRYIDKRGVFVNSFADAATFSSSSEALEFCLKKDVKAAEIVL